MALTLQHQTAAEFAARFWAGVRDAYQRGDKYEFAKRIWWVWTKVQDGSLTSDQVRLSFNNAFNRSLNTNQWNTFVTSTLVPIKDRYLAMRDQAGI